MAEEKQEKVLEVKNLRVSFRTNTGTVKAVRGISFSLYKGRTLAIVGESGSGKSVTSKAILGILANNKIVEDGQILFDGKNLLTLSEDKFTKIRGTKISMIFQDPLSALNPIMKVGKQLTEAMYLQHKATVKFAKDYLKKFNKVMAKYAVDSNEKTILSLSKYREQFETEDSLFEGLKINDYKDLFVKLANEEAKLFVENLNNAKKLLANKNVDYVIVGITNKLSARNTCLLSLKQIKELNCPKLAISLNNLYVDDQLQELTKVLKQLKEINVRTIIFTDFAVKQICDEISYQPEFVYNSETLATNYSQLPFYKENKINEVVLPRELF
mgnify:CR=1 FL=1